MILTFDEFKGLVDVPTKERPYQMKADIDKVDSMSDIERINNIHETYTAAYGYPIIINIEDVLKLKDKLCQG